MDSQLPKFRNQARQGDVLFNRISELPKEGLTRVPGERFAVAGNDTGHPHFVSGTGVQFFRSADPLTSYIVAPEGFVAEHCRPVDPHPGFASEPGVFEVINQIEKGPEGWQPVVD